MTPSLLTSAFSTILAISSSPTSLWSGLSIFLSSLFVKIPSLFWSIWLKAALISLNCSLDRPTKRDLGCCGFTSCCSSGGCGVGKLMTSSLLAYYYLLRASRSAANWSASSLSSSSCVGCGDWFFLERGLSRRDWIRKSTMEDFLGEFASKLSCSLAKLLFGTFPPL